MKFPLSDSSILCRKTKNLPTCSLKVKSALVGILHLLHPELNQPLFDLLHVCSSRPSRTNGHRVRLANDGRKVLSLAENGAFDLLFLDVHMPELDGFQVIQAIRERERFAGGHLPVVALTARSRNEYRERCLAAGMDDFLAKPIQAPDLWAAIDGVVEKDRRGNIVVEPTMCFRSRPEVWALGDCASSSSTPTRPPPMITNVRSRALHHGSVSTSARSNRSMT